MTKVMHDFALRPARLDDTAAVADLWNRRAAARGQPNAYSAADVEHRWSTPGFDMGTDTFLVWRGTDLVGYGQFNDVKEPHVDLFVGFGFAPGFESEDRLSDAVFSWFETRGRQALLRAPEGARVVLIAGAGGDEDSRQASLTRHGFVLDRVFRELRLELDVRPLEPVCAAAISVRTFHPGADDVELVLAYRDAFRKHYGYLEQPLEVEVERWRHWMKDAGFDPALWFLATSGAEICGFCCAYAASHGNGECGLVDEFGVRPAWRRRGIGRALLLETFRAMYDRGLKAVELVVDTDNTSGALGVYAEVGMTPTHENHTYVKELRPGTNWVAQ